MKISYVLLILVLCTTHMRSYAQKISQYKPFYIGKSQSLFDASKLSSPSARQSVTSKLELTVSATSKFVAKINYYNSLGNGNHEIAGELEGIPSSNFFIKFNDKVAEGNIILKNTKVAYTYYSDDQGNVYAINTDINKVVCIDYTKINTSNSTTSGVNAVAAISTATLNLQSYPNANGCVLLDFDGQYVVNSHWNNGNPIDAQAISVTDDNIQEAWEMISEDYRPFNVNITTSEAIYNTYPKNRRVRCIFTSTTTAAPGAGGVAYIGSFNWGDETPCWSFYGGGKAGGEAAAHEIGHTLGLGHDGRTTPDEGYYAGQGNWAPIMGVGYYKPIVQWSKGEYANANNTQDDLSIISSATYGLGYRADDRGNTVSTASPILYTSTGNVSATNNYGVIERNTDIDMFSFSTGGGTVTLNLNTVARHADLDIFATLYNSAGSAIGTFNPAGLPSNISTNLTKGTYYLAVNGTGVGNPATDGYSNYASLGAYTISGTIPPDTNASDLALNKPAITSSVESSSLTANFAVDGNSTTRWSSGYADPQWIYVDLGATYNINRVRLNWEVAYASAYEVQVSSDANTWAAVYSTTTGVGGINDLTVSGSGRYVRVYGTQRGTVYGYSLWDFEVYGVPSAAVTLYQHCNYASSGYAIGLAKGNYTTAQLVAKGISDNDISALKVSSGYEVVVYKNDNFKGQSNVFSADVSCLYSAELNDSTSSLRIRSTTNQLPTISFASPASGAVLNGPLNITLTTNASDADGDISKVEYFNGSVKIGEVVSAPYTITWSNVAPGSYTITATVTDDRAGQASASVTVQVVPLSAATVYQDCNYGGYAVDLVPGSYSLTQLVAMGVKNDDISSIKVNSGYEAILYQDNNFGGSAYLFKGDFSCLVNLLVNNAPINLNDWTSSIVVQASTAASASAQLHTQALQQDGRNKDLVLAPNPFVDHVRIQVENTEEEYVNIRIMNSKGREIMPLQKHKNGTELDLNNLSPDLYLIQIQTEHGLTLKKIIKL